MIKKLIKDGSLYSISGFISRGISLILLPFYVRFLTQEEYGLLDLVLLIVTFVNLTFSLELTQSIGRFLPSFRLIKPKIGIISTSLWILIGSYLIFFILYILFENFITRYIFQTSFGDKTYHLIGVYVVLNGLFLFFQNNLRWDLKSLNFTINSLIYTILNVILIFIFLLYFKLGINGVLSANILASFVAIFFSYLSQKKYYILFTSRKYAKKLLSFSAPLIFSSVSVYFSLYIDRIIINKYLGLSELAVFGVSYRFASLIGLLTMGFSSALIPLIYNSPYSIGTKNTIEKLFYFYIIGASLFLFFISLFSNEILLIFTTKEYFAANNIMPLITFSVIFSSLYIFFPGLSIEGKTKVLMIINLASALLNLALCLFLVSEYGVLGIAVATLLTALFSFSINCFFSFVYYKQYFSKRILSKIIGLSALSFSSVYFFSSLVEPNRLLNGILIWKAIVFILILVLSCLLIFKEILINNEDFNNSRC
jgi:O-antigen/teichoic acid export membrane protein